MIDLIKFQDLLSIQKIDGKTYVNDELRKKKIVLTPEEMVRQLFIKFLTIEQKISPRLIAVERQITILGRAHRFDILIFEKEGNPKMIVECKSFKVKLVESSAIQIGKYNMALNAEYLCITNGYDTQLYKVDFKNEEIVRLDKFPELKS